MEVTTVLNPVADRPGVEKSPGQKFGDWRHMNDEDRELPFQIDDVFADPLKPLYPLVQAADETGNPDLTTWMKTFAMFGIWNTSFKLEPLPIGRNVSNVQFLAICAFRAVANGVGYTPYFVVNGQRYSLPTVKGTTNMNFTENPVTGLPWKGYEFANMRIGLEGSGFVSDVSALQLICFGLYIRVTHEQVEPHGVVLVKPVSSD